MPVSLELNLASAVAKATHRLLPPIIVMYAFAFIDRANVGFAKIAYQADTGIGDFAYGLGAGLFFIGYALFELPSNLMLRRLGARILLSRMMMSWGLVSATMAFATTPVVFYLIRFLLGIAEAGFFPGIIFYLTYWFPEAQRARAFGLFYFGVPLAMLLGSPISGLLLDAATPFGLRNWQWMFLVEGLVSLLVGVGASVWLVSRPADARWLTSEEKTVLIDTLRAEEGRKPSSVARTILGALGSRRVILLIAIYFCIQIGNAPLAFYLPAKLAAGFGGEVDTRVGFLLALPWLCTMAVMRWATTFADRHGHHQIIAAGMLAVGALAFVSLSYISSPWLILSAFCIATPGLVACQPLFWSLPVRHLTGRGAASGIAFIGSIGNLGGFVSPQIKTMADNFDDSSDAGFLAVAAICLVGALLLVRVRNHPASASPGS